MLAGSLSLSLQPRPGVQRAAAFAAGAVGADAARAAYSGCHRWAESKHAGLRFSNHCLNGRPRLACQHVWLWRTHASDNTYSSLPLLLLPSTLRADLAKLAGPKARTHPGAEKSVRLAVSMLIKTVLQVRAGA